MCGLEMRVVVSLDYPDTRTRVRVPVPGYPGYGYPGTRVPGTGTPGYIAVPAGGSTT